jgi:hypothetical protein
MTLHKYAYISGNPNVLYKDVMGAQNHLRLEMLRAARDLSEVDHRNVMAAVDRSETLRKEQSLHGQEAMRGGPASEAAEKALLVGRALDESALAMLERLEAVLQKDKARNKSLLEGEHQDQLNGGAAGMSSGGATSPAEPRCSARESKAPVYSTSCGEASSGKTWSRR